MIFIVSVIVVTVAYSAKAQVPSSVTQVPIIHNAAYMPDTNGSYYWAYETANEIIQNEKPYIKLADIPKQEVQVGDDGYSYKGLDGNNYTVTSVVDENGFRPRGN